MQCGCLVPWSSLRAGMQEVKLPPVTVLDLLYIKSSPNLSILGSVAMVDNNSREALHKGYGYKISSVIGSPPSNLNKHLGAVKAPRSVAVKRYFELLPHNGAEIPPSLQYSETEGDNDARGIFCLHGW